MPEWATQGTHRYYVQSDILFWESHGEITLDDVKVVVAVSERIRAQYGYVLCIYDARDRVSIGMAARRYTVEQGRANSANGVGIIIGASVALATIMKLLQNAYRLFGKASSSTQYCITEEEAWTLANSERERLRAAVSSGSN